MKMFLSVLSFIIIFSSVLLLPVSGEDDTYYGGDMIFSRPVKSVLFSHARHVYDLGFSCNTCHNGIFMMDRGSAEESGDFNMKSLSDGKYCGVCHNGEAAFSSGTQCARCHTGVKGLQRFPKGLTKAKEHLVPGNPLLLGEGPMAVLFSHESHTSIFGCMECHTEIFSLKRGETGIKMNGIYQGKYCGKCHDGETAFSVDDCSACHPGMAANTE